MSSTATAPVPASTERLVFSLWRTEHFPLALALWGDPRVSALIGGPFSEAKARERLEMELAQQRLHGVQYWPIFLKEGSEHVGCCGLRPYDLPRGVYELGFQLRAEHWGKGLATEAARSVIKYAFENSWRARALCRSSSAELELEAGSRETGPALHARPALSAHGAAAPVILAHARRIPGGSSKIAKRR